MVLEDRVTFLEQLIGSCIAVIHRYDNKIYLGRQEDCARLLPVNSFLSFPFFGDLICVQTPEELHETENFALSSTISAIAKEKEEAPTDSKILMTAKLGF